MKRIRLFALFTIFVALTILFSTFAWGFNEDHLKQLNATNVCQNCDLTEANLASMDFYSANLSGSDLSGANLKGTILWDANLREANLTGAIINKNTNFSGAFLGNTIWIDGKKCAEGSIGSCDK